MEPLSIFLIVGLSFAFILLLTRLTHLDYKNSTQLLSILIISILIIELFYGYLYGTRYILQVPHLTRLNTPFNYLIGPAIYFLIISYSTPKINWDKIKLLHLTPFLLATLYLLPLYVSPIDTKRLYIENMYQELTFDSYLLGGGRRIQQAVYLVATISFIIQYKRKLKIQREWNTSRSLTMAFLILWSISIFRYFFSFDLLSAMLDSFILSAIAIFLVYRLLSATSKNAKSSALDINRLQRTMEKINALLTIEKNFLDPQFTIKELADRLESSVPLVSNTINRITGTNFNELINRLRVEESINLLKSSETKHLTIEAISLSAGFNSVSAFNDNFKKITGKTPKQFRTDDDNIA